VVRVSHLRAISTICVLEPDMPTALPPAAIAGRDDFLVYEAPASTISTTSRDPCRLVVLQLREWPRARTRSLSATPLELPRDSAFRARDDDGVHARDCLSSTMSWAKGLRQSVSFPWLWPSLC